MVVIATSLPVATFGGKIGSYKHFSTFTYLCPHL